MPEPREYAIWDPSGDNEALKMTQGARSTIVSLPSAFSTSRPGLFSPSSEGQRRIRSFSQSRDQPKGSPGWYSTGCGRRGRLRDAWVSTAQIPWLSAIGDPALHTPPNGFVDRGAETGLPLSP